MGLSRRHYLWNRTVPISASSQRFSLESLSRSDWVMTEVEPSADGTHPRGARNVPGLLLLGLRHVRSRTRGETRMLTWRDEKDGHRKGQLPHRAPRGYAAVPASHARSLLAVET